MVQDSRGELPVSERASGHLAGVGAVAGEPEPVQEQAQPPTEDRGRESSFNCQVSLVCCVVRLTDRPTD